MLNSRAWARFELKWLQVLLIGLVLIGAAGLGYRASSRWLAFLVLVIGALALLQRPVWGLLALILVALVVPLGIDTGTEVELNTATLLIPVLALLWLLAMLLRDRVGLAPSAANRPLLLFLGASLLSLVIGIATWDTAVPRGANFALVQLAQWAIFAFSALAFWLTANLGTDERSLSRLAWVFLLVGGGFALLRMAPGLGDSVAPLTTVAFIRAPFWILLSAMAGGQLLFNRKLSLLRRAYLLLVLAGALIYAFVQQQEAASNWVGLAAALGILIWLRFPRLRWPVVLTLVLLVALGVLIPSVYEFAGGDAEWSLSGGSRLTLIERVVEVSMRNPITGLGPAAYRPYANMKPLQYQNAYWITPQISSHNNYIDLFAHGGILGLALFGWFCVEIARIGRRLHLRYREGFASGYTNGILAAGVGSLAIMLLADWILPFVYNIGFEGFQASVLVWLFLGGLVVLDQGAIVGEKS